MNIFLRSPQTSLPLLPTPLFPRSLLRVLRETDFFPVSSGLRGEAAAEHLVSPTS